jgi:hypothetical protein
VAAGLCLLPAVGTMVALRATEHRTPVEAVGAVLLAPVVRLAVVLLGGMVLWRVVPEFRAAPARFWAWVLGLYLYTLVVETGLVLARPARRPTERVPSGASPGSPHGRRSLPPRQGLQPVRRVRDDRVGV